MKGLTREQLSDLKKTDYKIICNTCGEEKHVSKYTGKTSKINNLYYINYRCNKCCYDIKMTKYKKNLVKYFATQQNKELNTLDGRAAMLRNRCFQRSKRSSYEFNLPKQVILDKLKRGICEATGLKLDFTYMNYNPYSPSIDRIDSNKGYTEDNIQVTCLIYNFCKNKFTEEQVKDFFSKMKNGE